MDMFYKFTGFCRRYVQV